MNLISSKINFIIYVIVIFSGFTYLNYSLDLKYSDFKPCFNINEKSRYGTLCKPLLACRFRDLDHLKTKVNITYNKDYTIQDTTNCTNSTANIIYVSNNERLKHVLKSGTRQSDLINIQSSNLMSKIFFTIQNLKCIRKRKELEKVHYLSRRREDIYGSRAVAFYNISEAIVKNINTPDIAIDSYRDTLEKGYLNTFNHILSQAIITSFFSLELADMVGDLHELENMPQLACGVFSTVQLADTTNNPVDNYVDIINNLIGQKIGLKLRSKFCIRSNSFISNEFITCYLNDIQNYLSWSLGIGISDFKPNDELIIKFTQKLNILLHSN